MSSLFPAEPISLHLPDADIVYYPTFFTSEAASDLYQELLREIPWQQDNIKVFGKEHAQPL